MYGDRIDMLESMITEAYTPTPNIRFESGKLMQLWQGHLGTQEWREVEGND